MSPVEIPKLTPTQIKVLVALLEQGRELGNTELKRLVGAPLTGKPKDRLIELGLIRSGKRGQQLFHALTDDGRRVAITLKTPKPTPPEKKPARPSGLTPNQILALVVLMAEARELTNQELGELAGFSLTGRDNTALERHGYVVTDRSSRPFSHQLTDRGWHFTRTLHQTAPPDEGRSAIRSLFTLLANVHRSLDRLHLSYAEFFKQGSSATSVRAEAVSGDNVEAAIRAAYKDLAKAPGNWVGLADLREKLGDLDRATVDDALRAMERQDDVRIIPVANTKSLSPRDRAAALRIGDEDNHTLSIGRS